ncbi:hypothetical protein D3C81_1505740 [compost metagenome]
MQAVTQAAVAPRENIARHPVAQARLVAYACQQSVSRTVEYPLRGQCGRQRRDHQRKGSERDQETFALNRVAYQHERDTQAGCQAFRQGGDVDHLFRGKRGNRRRRGFGKQPVGIILDDAHIAALRDAGELLAPAFRHGDGGRVL